jgi:hypothetical protein
MGMQITPEGGEFGLVAADGFNWGHGGLREHELGKRWEAFKATL